MSGSRLAWLLLRSAGFAILLCAAATGVATWVSRGPSVGWIGDYLLTATLKHIADPPTQMFTSVFDVSWAFTDVGAWAGALTLPPGGTSSSPPMEIHPFGEMFVEFLPFGGTYWFVVIAGLTGWFIPAGDWNVPKPNASPPE